MKKKQLTQKIKEVLCIDFEKATEKELLVPLYNVVAAFLLAEGAGENIPIRAHIDKQATFWQTEASITDAQGMSCVNTLFEKKKNKFRLQHLIEEIDNKH